MLGIWKGIVRCGGTGSGCNDGDKIKWIGRGNMKKKVVVGVSILLLVSFFGIAIVSAKSTERGNKSLQGMIEQFITQISGLEKEIFTLNATVEANKSAIQVLEDENVAHEGENAALEDENAILSSQNLELLQQNLNLQRRVAYTDLWRVPLDKDAILGKWDVVGFCADPMTYQPDTVFPGEMYLRSVTFSDTMRHLILAMLSIRMLGLIMLSLKKETELQVVS